MRLCLLHPDPAEADRLGACLGRDGHEVLRLRALRDLDAGGLAGTPGVAVVHGTVLANAPTEERGFLGALREGGTRVLAIAGAGDSDLGPLDDYVLEPVREEELCLRVRRLAQNAVQHDGEIHVPPYVFRPHSHQVYVHGRPVHLTGKEYDLALHFFWRVGQALSRVELGERIWGHTPQVDSRTLDAHVSNLRRKLAIGPANGLRLASVYGFGYCLQSAVGESLARSA